MSRRGHPASKSALLVVTAAAVLSAVLGSVHAFSVFLEPLEVRFGASRASVSLTYSLALVALTAAVLLGHRVFGRWSAAAVVLGTGFVAATGALIAATAPALWVVWLGYSLVFGAANGFGYGFGLQIAAQASPGREGLAMGIVTAAYALGAAVAPGVFVWALVFGGFAGAMIVFACALALFTSASARLMSLAEARFAPDEALARGALRARAPVPRLWIGYGAGVAAGLMAIGHAAGIAATAATPPAPWVAPALIAVCNLAGSLAAGRFADVAEPRTALLILPLLSAAALVGVALVDTAAALLGCLGLIGFAYGGLIAAYPAAIAKSVGMVQSARIYGRVFTAWGAAGLTAPWLAGALFDQTGGYGRAALTAAALGLVSAIAGRGLAVPARTSA